MNNKTYEGAPLPCYIIEEYLLRRNLSVISDVARRSNTEIILAFKAFALWKAFPIFREYINATTASSPDEAKLSLTCFGSKAHTYSPAYEDSTFDTILECSSHITFNSLSQMEHFAPKVMKHNSAAEQKISCGIRINPEWSEVEVELYNPCAPGTRFGVCADQLPDTLPEPIEGFHCHCHCESSSEELRNSLKAIDEKFGKWLPKLKWLNLGGGHLMTRKNYNIDLLVELLNSLHSKYPNLKIILEPGSAFAWQTGPLVSEVVDIVENKGIKTAILNVSFTCHMPDCLEMPYMPTVRGAKTMEQKNPPTEKNAYRLGGNSCLSGDYLGFWIFDHELKIGEKIIFEDMIHYTTVKTNTFNGIHHPSIGMLHSDGTFELYKNFSFVDYKNRMC